MSSPAADTLRQRLQDSLRHSAPTLTNIAGVGGLALLAVGAALPLISGGFSLATLDLSCAIHFAYSEARYDLRIDYRADPPLPHLTPDDASWLDTHLWAHSGRTVSPASPWPSQARAFRGTRKRYATIPANGAATSRKP